MPEYLGLEGLGVCKGKNPSGERWGKRIFWGRLCISGRGVKNDTTRKLANFRCLFSEFPFFVSPAFFFFKFFKSLYLFLLWGESANFPLFLSKNSNFFYFLWWQERKKLQLPLDVCCSGVLGFPSVLCARGRSLSHSRKTLPTLEMLRNAGC